MGNSWQASLIKDPESAFQLPDLSYKSTEIRDIYDRFDKALIPKQVHEQVKELLRAVLDFRHSTDPNPLFSKMRAETKTDKELESVFSTMQAAFLKAKSHLAALSDADKKILDTAMEYCKRSINQRMNMLQKDDCLMPFWNKSELKKEVS